MENVVYIQYYISPKIADKKVLRLALEFYFIVKPITMQMHCYWFYNNNANALLLVLQ